MSELIVAGGTGQEVALAVIRLAYLCGTQYPRIWVFDSDVGALAEGGRSRAQTLQDLQQQLRACGVWDDTRLHFLNPTVLPNRTERIERISDVFGQFGQLDREQEDLLTLMLSDEQRETSINDGFHGQPALGALALAAAFEQGAYDEFLEELRQQAASQTGLRAVLAGSIAGGTGTSVIPFVAKELRRLAAQGAGHRVEVLGVFQLPWFELTPVANDPLSRPPDVDTAMFDRNASCLLRGYLEQTFHKEIDSAVVVGLPRPVQRASHGGNRQPETHHYVCLVAGITALNLLSQRSTESALGSEWRGFHAPSLGTPGSTTYQGPPHGPAVFLDGKGPVSVGRLVKQALNLVAFTAALLEETESLTPSFGHQRVVFEALSALQTLQEREDLRSALAMLHRVHVEILDWLKGTLMSEVGEKRADNLGAFVPIEGWSALFDNKARNFLSRTGAWLPLPALSRRVIRRSGPFPETGTERGRRAVWGLVHQARRNFVDAA